MSEQAISERESRDIWVSKLVSAARALVTYQVGLPHGVTRISNILYELGWHSNDEYMVFRAYLSDTKDLPIGSERLLTERNALHRFDERLERINANYRDEIFETSFRIIDEMGGVDGRLSQGSEA